MTELTKYTLKDLNSKKTLKITSRCHKMKVKVLTRGLLLETEEVLGKVVDVAAITNQKIKALNKFKLTMGHQLIIKNNRM